MSDQDERPIYSDTGYFTRGRSGFRPDATDDSRKVDLIVCLCAVVVIVLVFAFVRLTMPTIS